MSLEQGYDSRTIKGRKTVGHPPSLSNPGHSGPTTFFLRSDKDLEKSTRRGRQLSRGFSMTDESSVKTPPASSMGDSTFGVESLADTIHSTSSSEDTILSRTDSNDSASAGIGAERSAISGRKRKAGNPGHPTILATGQRIISSEHLSSAGSPISFRSAESPLRSRSHLRRGSTSSSINMNSQPLTPLKMSPQPESAMPSTPRSGSLKSFRLSDEESIVDDGSSQVIQSSRDEGEDDVVTTESSKDGSMPQLVMPSIAIATRRPFTDRGKRMGRLKVMVVGNSGTGKTSLITSLYQCCEDIVHVDPPSSSSDAIDMGHDVSFPWTGLATRQYPAWWTDFESRRMLLRRKSIGDGKLERNLCFVDTPGIDRQGAAKQVLEYFCKSLQRTASIEKMTDSELVQLLSGDGGVQIDAVLWLFDAASSPDLFLKDEQKQLLDLVCRCSNLIPLIAHADTIQVDELETTKEQIRTLLVQAGVEAYDLASTGNQTGLTLGGCPTAPFAISTVFGNDSEMLDASVLMSSQYVPPLVPSELGYVVNQLLEPENMARMRHVSATKFLLWRQQNLGLHMNLQTQTLLRSPHFGRTLPSVTDTGSILDDPSKVLVPHSTSSYYRSPSPSISDASAPSHGNTTSASAHALAHHNEQTQGQVIFRQVRLAKWAQDLQRSLDNERKKYKEMYLNRPSHWSSANTEDHDASDNEKALTTANGRPQRGRLGGDIAIIDPRDPLGVLAFSQAFRRRGWFALQIAGGCGLIGGLCWWVMRNWVEVQEWFGPGSQPAFAIAQQSPSRGLLGWIDDVNWRGFFGWER
jgi:hypothetical protein